jgi:hypothetical protein
VSEKGFTGFRACDGALLAVVGVKLINHADRRKPAAE